MMISREKKVDFSFKILKFQNGRFTPDTRDPEGTVSSAVCDGRSGATDYCYYRKNALINRVDPVRDVKR